MKFFLWLMLMVSVTSMIGETFAQDRRSRSSRSGSSTSSRSSRSGSSTRSRPSRSGSSTRSRPSRSGSSTRSRPSRSGSSTRSRPSRPSRPTTSTRPSRPNRPTTSTRPSRPSRPTTSTRPSRPSRQTTSTKPRPNRGRDISRPRPSRPRRDRDVSRPTRRYRGVDDRAAKRHRSYVRRGSRTRHLPSDINKRRRLRDHMYKRYRHRPAWYRTNRSYVRYVHAPYYVRRNHSIRYYSYSDYYRTLPYRYVYYDTWVRYRYNYRDGYQWINGYPYYIYNGYLHRYSHYDECNFELVDGYSNTTYTTYYSYTCATGYDLCSNLRDQLNYQQSSYRYFCSERLDRKYDHWDYRDVFYGDLDDIFNQNDDYYDYDLNTDDDYYDYGY